MSGTGPQPRGKLRGIRSRPTSKGELRGSDPGPHPRGKFRGIRSRPTPKGEIQGDQDQTPPPEQLLLRAVRILLECILVYIVLLGKIQKSSKKEAEEFFRDKSYFVRSILENNHTRQKHGTTVHFYDLGIGGNDTMWTITRRKFLVDGQPAHWLIRKFSTIYNALDPQTEAGKQVEF